MVTWGYAQYMVFLDIILICLFSFSARSWPKFMANRSSSPASTRGDDRSSKRGGLSLWMASKENKQIKNQEMFLKPYIAHDPLPACMKF